METRIDFGGGGGHETRVHLYVDRVENGFSD